MNEFCVLLDSGKKPDLETFLARRPRIARKLRPTLEGLLIVEAVRPILQRR